MSILQGSLGKKMSREGGITKTSSVFLSTTGASRLQFKGDYLRVVFINNIVLISTLFNK